MTKAAPEVPAAPPVGAKLEFEIQEPIIPAPRPGKSFPKFLAIAGIALLAIYLLHRHGKKVIAKTNEDALNAARREFESKSNGKSLAVVPEPVERDRFAPARGVDRSGRSQF